MAPIILSVKASALGPPRPFSPSVPAVGRQLLIVRAAAYASDSGESLTDTVFWSVGTNKSYVKATSDLCLFIHASNLLSSLPTPLPYIYMPATGLFTVFSVQPMLGVYHYMQRGGGGGGGGGILLRMYHWLSLCTLFYSYTS